jgi:flagellar motor switch protein FliM/N
VPGQGPNFLPFPFARLRRLGRRDAAIESAVSRWIAPGRLGAKVAALAGGPVRARFLGVVAQPADPHPAIAEVRYAGLAITVTASSRPVRALAQRLLGGAAELDAPRPPTVAEHALWALAVGAALADLAIAAEVWPCAGSPDAAGDDAVTIGFVVELPPALGGMPMTVTARCGAELLLRAPPGRTLHGWRFDLPIVVGRCALPRAGVGGLAARDVITLERCLELDLGTGGIGLSAMPGAVEARVATEYVPRDMAQLDHAMLEVTVQLGTTRLSLRQLGELAIGQIVALGRPLAGPYEVRAAGRVVGQGELVDIDGELGVRIVSIADQPDQE